MLFTYFQYKWSQKLNRVVSIKYINRMINAGNLQVSTNYESTNQRELNLSRKVHMSELNLNIGEINNNFYK